MRTSLLVLSSVVLSACGGGAASAHTAITPDGTYEVHLTRHVPVGLAWSEVTHFVMSQHQTVRVGGTPVEDATTNSTVDLSADYTLLENDANGQPLRMRIEVRELTIDAGEGPTSPTIPSVLLVVRGAPGTITGENGEPIDAATLAHLHHVIPARSHPTDDDLVFGTRTPQAVGASWPIDAGGAARGLGEVGLTVQPANVGGSTTLVSATTEGGVDALTLRSRITASHVGVPNLPPGSVEQHADLEASVEFVLPLDTSLPPLRDIQRSAVDLEVAMVTPGGPGIVNVVIHEEETHQRTLH